MSRFTCTGKGGVSRRRILQIGAAVATGLLTAVSLRAGNTFFNKTSGVWNNSANWDTGLLPTANDSAYVGYTSKTNPATVFLHAGDSCVASNLYLGQNGAAASGILVMDGGTLTLTKMTVSDNSGTGVVMQTGGVIVEDSFAAGSNTRGFPSWIITGAGTVVSNLSTNAASYFPYRGSGSGAQLVISNNATMIGGAISLAQQSGGTCTMTIASGGLLKGLTGDLVVGNGGVDLGRFDVERDVPGPGRDLHRCGVHLCGNQGDPACGGEGIDVHHPVIP